MYKLVHQSEAVPRCHWEDFESRFVIPSDNRGAEGRVLGNVDEGFLFAIGYMKLSAFERGGEDNGDCREISVLVEPFLTEDESGNGIPVNPISPLLV
jgi:hypothetical protein